MSYLSTSPEAQTVIRLEARKSFSLALWIMDFMGHALDITDCQLRMVVRKNFVASDPGDAANLIISSDAFLSAPEKGYARFDIQASELDHPAGEYQYAVVLVASGYSAVILEGVIDLAANTEFSSVDDSFTAGVNPVSQLEIKLREQHAVKVYAGQALAPGTFSFTTADKQHLDDLWVQGWTALANKPVFGTAAFVNVSDIAMPAGGSPGSALLKSSGADYDTHWAQVATGGTGLTATGQPAGAVPTASGVNTWDWIIPVPAVQTVNGAGGIVVLDSDDIDDTGKTHKFATAAEKAKLAFFSATPAYSDLAGLPTLGTIASHAVGEFLGSATMISNTIIPKVTALRGTSRGTAAPSGGVDGDQYRQYT
jgi:hypothetical protein